MFLAEGLMLNCSARILNKPWVIQLEPVRTQRGNRIGPVNEKPVMIQRGFGNAGHAAREQIDEGKLDGPGVRFG